MKDILILSNRDVLGGRYWSQKRPGVWYGSQIECTALAYELIHQIEPSHKSLAQIRQFLLSAQDVWNGQTVETARMLQVLVEAFKLENAAGLSQSPKLQIAYGGDSFLYDAFPQELSVPPTGVKNPQRRSRSTLAIL